MTWTTDGWPFMEDWAHEGAVPEDHPGLWHVTTAAPTVLAEGRLRSRRQIGRSRAIGLGGGLDDVAADKVSVVTRPEDASRVARAMQVAALAVHDRIPAWRVAWEAQKWSNWPELVETHGNLSWDLYGDDEDRAGEPWAEEAQEFDEALDEARQCLSGLWGNAREHGIYPESIEQARGYAQTMNLMWSRARGLGRTRYNLIQAIERCTHGVRRAIGVKSETDQEAILSPVGFTQPQWDRVDPRSIKVLRLAGRVGAHTDIEPAEAELRFDPEDLRVVGVETITGLRKLADARKAVLSKTPIQLTLF